MVYGFKQTKFDGTEYVFDNETMSIPVSFSYKNMMPKALNQGSEPICVPCSISSYIDWRDKVYNTKTVDFDIKKTFKEAGGTANGMSFKDALHYNYKQGNIRYYAIVGSILQLKNALIANGPCVGALPVRNSSVIKFWDPNIDGFEGGHAIAIVGYDEDGFIIRNSWGTTYGEDGYARIRYEDFNNFYEIWTMS